MKWIKLILVLTLITSSTLACSDKDQQATDQENKDQKKTKAQGKEKSTKILTAHYLEEEVETMEEVDHTTIIISDRDAYVSLELKEIAGLHLNEELKNKVVGLIRSTDPDINDIYVSNNTDFNTRMHGLSRDIERGLPAKEIGESFEQSVRRVFPELKR
jgi:spore cortex protein